jgi:thiol-disulfide isomerase/thioredoxin
MSDWNSPLTQEQRRSEVLARFPTAAYVCVPVKHESPEFSEFSKFVRLNDVEHGYMDFSQATEEERRKYEEFRKDEAERPPDESWHFVVPNEKVDLVRHLTVFEAQSASLGYSSKSAGDAWLEAWEKLKLAEERDHRVRIIALVLLLLFFVAAIGLIWSELR